MYYGSKNLGNLGTAYTLTAATQELRADPSSASFPGTVASLERKLASLYAQGYVAVKGEAGVTDPAALGINLDFFEQQAWNKIVEKGISFRSSAGAAQPQIFAVPDAMRPASMQPTSAAPGQLISQSTAGSILDLFKKKPKANRNFRYPLNYQQEQFPWLPILGVLALGGVALYFVRRK